MKDNMSDASNNQGRAYEFACLTSLYEAISKIRPAQFIYNTSYKAAENAWNTLSRMDQNLYILSAKSTIETIFALEPNIIEETPDILSLYIQTDHRGEEADKTQSHGCKTQLNRQNIRLWHKMVWHSQSSKQNWKFKNQNSYL